MQRLLFPLLLCLATTACSVSSSSADTTGTTDTANTSDNPLAGQRPNIIIVLTDDQGYGDLACHGHPYLRTPNLDRLYTQSTRLTDFHASPTCAPTRAALMSGKYAFANGVTHTILERERMALSSYTIAQSLQDAGYATAIFGKWHLGDEEPYQPGSRGFEEVFIHGAGGIGQAFPGSCADAPGNRYFNPVIRHNGSFVRTSGFCTDVFFQQALGWIREQGQNQDEPFFAYISTNAPHSPYICPDDYKPYYQQHTDDNRRVGFYGMIENIDDNMGELMARLEQWGLAENTLLIFMSDNGSAKGDFSAGMLGMKSSYHEGGSRVPSFWRWPGRLEPGRDIDTLLRHVDYFPTLAQIAGAQIPQAMDGRSMLPLLNDPAAPWEDRYTFFHCGRWGKADVPGGRWGRGNPDPESLRYEQFAVRSERWRYEAGDTLFDIDADPGQTTNVIEQHPEVAAQMRAAYDAWWDSVRPMMVNEDATLPPQRPYHVWFKQQQQAGGISDWVPPVLD